MNRNRISTAVIAQTILSSFFENKRTCPPVLIAALRTGFYSARNRTPPPLSMDEGFLCSLAYSQFNCPRQKVYQYGGFMYHVVADAYGPLLELSRCVRTRFCQSTLHEKFIDVNSRRHLADYGPFQARSKRPHNFRNRHGQNIFKPYTRLLDVIGYFTFLKLLGPILPRLSRRFRRMKVGYDSSRQPFF